MTNFVTTKRALLTSVLSLTLCFAMLLGTTFAWFTDTVTSSGNVIQTGDLDVKLYQHTSETTKVEITDDSDPIFGTKTGVAGSDTADTLWEPGKTQTVYFSIENAGSLALSYKVAIEVTNITKNLNKVLSYIITPDAEYGEVAKTNLDWATGSRVNSGLNYATADGVDLIADATHYFALSVHMDEEAGDEYQDANITFNIKVIASQLAYESDSFDEKYDVNAMYPGLGYVEVPSKEEFPVAGFDVDILNKNDEKVGSMNFPAAAIAENVTQVKGTIDVTDTYEGGNITIESGYEVLYYDITASGLKSDNDAQVTVRVYVGEGYDANTFTVYHYEEVIESWYNPETGYVSFKTTSFSPFAVVYDKDSVHNPYDPNDTTALPQASVIRSEEYENVDLDWGSYGQWSPTSGLNNHLEAAYTFSCLQTPEQAEKSKYAEWYCDFVVVLDEDLGANEIFLGGNYGSFGWVGFHNGDLTLEAGTEIPLLGSVTSNPWTYADVANSVGTFICGVGHVGDALDGATFTVYLRLTNPENEAEFYNVAEINYTFE